MVLVIAERRPDGINPATFEAIAAAQQIGEPVTVVIPGPHDDAVAQVASADVAEVIALEHEALSSYTADGFAGALSPFIAEAKPDYIAAAQTYQVRDFFPRLAARAGRAVAADCTAVDKEGSALVLRRPMFQGKITAELTFDGPPPHFLTFQAGAFRAESMRRGAAAAPIRRLTAALDPSVIRQRADPPFREAKQAVDLTQAERIVAVGRGIKEEARLGVARDLAAALGAELAASRPICDAGWLPMDRQVGSSGQTVSPKLYVALGISGAIQHIVGMKGSRTIVAINKDPDAPIFEIADYGVVGDLFEVVPELVKVLKS